eukprot:COSAG02_NODE_15352_length_1179_cov_1.306481_1_plen_278_part_01
MLRQMTLGQRLQVTSALDTAKRLQDSGEWGAARRKYTELLDRAETVLPPGDLSEIHDRRGRCCEQEGALESALEDYYQAIAASGERHSLLLHRARLLCRLGRWTEAEWDLSVAATLQPQHAATHALLRKARAEARSARIRVVFTAPAELGISFNCVPDPACGKVRELGVTEVDRGSQAEHADPRVQAGWRVVGIGGTSVNTLTAAEALSAMHARPLILEFEKSAVAVSRDTARTEAVHPTTRRVQAVHDDPAGAGAADAATTIHYAYAQDGGVTSAEV